ncbi:response regulator [Desulfobacter curvatus]|uniref:response regulator n=1 Tax=Desulfobacter curvatus TaxID=2290 RepID=UPI00036F5E35|nr:response regulator [Desulfobacter curvatus]
MASDDTPQVVVADDHPKVLEAVDRMFMGAGISCQTFLNGDAALSFINAGNIPKLVLVDIMMPGLSGYTVCETLRETFSAHELPIIMFTGSRNPDALIKAYNVGANDYITKPFSSEELIARVQCQLALQKAHLTLQKNLRLEMELKKQKQKEAQACRAAMESKREKLRYQINPHFLFNALASIRGAVFSNQDAAYDMITHLAEFYRLSLSRGAIEMQTIAGEMSMIEHYLEIEKIRHGNYLSVDIAVDPYVENIKIPSLVLQPLVENAVKYGNKTSPAHLGIRISATLYRKTHVRIIIANTGKWMAPSDSTAGTGIGIQNVTARLKAFYPDTHTFEKHEDNGEVRIEIILPA